MADSSVPPFGNPDVITASYDVTAFRRGPKRKHLLKYHQSSKPHCHSFYSREIWRGEGRTSPTPTPLPPPSWSENTEQKPRLDRVKSYLSAHVIYHNIDMSLHIQVTFLDSSVYFNLQKFQIDQTGKHAFW